MNPYFKFKPNNFEDQQVTIHTHKGAKVTIWYNDLILCIKTFGAVQYELSQYEDEIRDKFLSQEVREDTEDKITKLCNDTVAFYFPDKIPFLVKPNVSKEGRISLVFGVIEGFESTLAIMDYIIGNITYMIKNELDKVDPVFTLGVARSLDDEAYLHHDSATDKTEVYTFIPNFNVNEWTYYTAIRYNQDKIRMNGVTSASYSLRNLKEKLSGISGNG